MEYQCKDKRCWSCELRVLFWPVWLRLKLSRSQLSDSAVFAPVVKPNSTMAHVAYRDYGTVDLSEDPQAFVSRRRSRSASPPAPGTTHQMRERTRSPPQSDSGFSARRGHGHSRASSLSAPRYNHLAQHGFQDRHSPSPLPSDNSGRSSPSPSPFPPAQPRHYPSRHRTPNSSSPGSSQFAPSRPVSVTESSRSYSTEDIHQMHISDLLWVPSVAELHDEFLQMKEQINQLLDQEKHLFERSRKADILLEQVQQLQLRLGQYDTGFMRYVINSILIKRC